MFGMNKILLGIVCFLALSGTVLAMDFLGYMCSYRGKPPIARRVSGGGGGDLTDWHSRTGYTDWHSRAGYTDWKSRS